MIEQEGGGHSPGQERYTDKPHEELVQIFRTAIEKEVKRFKGHYSPELIVRLQFQNQYGSHERFEFFRVCSQMGGAWRCGPGCYFETTGGVTAGGERGMSAAPVTSHRIRSLWAPPPVPQPHHRPPGMRFPTSRPSSTRSWLNSPPWRPTAAGRRAAGPSRRWPGRNCARRSWRFGALASAACNGGPSANSPASC